MKKCTGQPCYSKDNTKDMKNIIKSCHFWFWLIYIIGIIFYFSYKDYLLGQNDISKTLEVIQVYFIYIMFTGIWLFIYFLWIMNADIDDV